MLKLSELEIIQRIQDGELFECEMSDGSFTLKIESYTPTICLAVHAGHRLRTRLISLCRLNEAERLYEEDPHTESFIQAMPITLVALDSRYEYDLNRPVSRCIYSIAWNKVVWHKKLTAKERKASVAKHQAFYRVVDALVAVIEKRFGAALLFDVHSYNHLRLDRANPVFNLGTEQIDSERWQNMIEFLIKRLQKFSLPNIPVTVAKDDVFYGRGYLIAHINSRFQNTLVLPLEVKKIFMDELTGELYPLVMQALSQQIKECLVDTSLYFARRYTVKSRATKAEMLTDKMDPAVLKLDRALYRLAKGLETLYYINPINLQSEKKRFFKYHGKYLPNFRYRQLEINPYHFREQLYRLPVDAIRDPSVQSLYRDVIDNLSDKIAMLVKAGQAQFVYESLKYYGEPSLIDEENAHFLLHAQNFDDPINLLLSTDEIIARFESTAKRWGMSCRIETSSKLVASAMVSDRRRAVLVAKGLQLSETETLALINHELGVHMATTLNANKQRLKVFSLGLPRNTMTQEGLAILNEFQSGYMLMKRLKGLAHRVIAVREMLKHGDFRHTYHCLNEDYKLTQDQAFNLTVRVHRAGGFTKDYLYLNGVSRALQLAGSQNIKNLYVGKTGFDYLPVINELVARQLVIEPVYYPRYLEQPEFNSPVMDYLMRCIQYSNDEQTRITGFERKKIAA